MSNKSFCDVCKITLSSNYALQRHLKSNTHQKKEALAMMEESKQDDGQDQDESQDEDKTQHEDEDKDEYDDEYHAQLQQKIKESVQEIINREDGHGDNDVRRLVVVHDVMPKEKEAIYQSIIKEKMKIIRELKLDLIDIIEDFAQIRKINESDIPDSDKEKLIYMTNIILDKIREEYENKGICPSCLQEFSIENSE
jgi:hypothetical protein